MNDDIDSGEIDWQQQLDVSDELYVKAVKAVTLLGEASPEIIHRIFDTGVAKSGRIMDRLEEDGYVAFGFGTRKVRNPPIPNPKPKGQTDYEKAVIITMRALAVSPSMLQRLLRIRYATAVRLMDRLEADGVIGPANGTRPREFIGLPEHMLYLFDAEHEND